jgi:hypothetical protein
VSVLLGYGHVRADGLVLPVHQHPQAELVLRDLEVVGNSRFEGGIGLRLEDAELRKFGSWQVFVVK